MAEQKTPEQQKAEDQKQSEEQRKAQERDEERKKGSEGKFGLGEGPRTVKQQVYRTDTQAAVARERGDDDSEGERELELPEDVERVRAYTQVDPEVSLETVNPEDRDRALGDEREGEVGLTKEERFARKEEARDARDARESRRAREHKESRDSGR